MNRQDAKNAKFLTSFPDWGNRSGKTTQERGMEKGMEKGQGYTFDKFAFLI